MPTGRRCAAMEMPRPLPQQARPSSAAPDTTARIHDYLRSNPDADPAIRAQLLSLLSDQDGSITATLDATVKDVDVVIEGIL